MTRAFRKTSSPKKEQQLTCRKCRKKSDFADEYCSNCGKELPDWENRRTILNLRVAQNSIAFIAGIFFLSFIWAFLFEKASLLILAENLVVGLIMTVLFFYSKKFPRPAVFTATGLFVGLLVLSAILNPETIFQGIILKLAGIVISLNAIRSVFG